jgi:RNA recognition motif-containing protein
MIESDLRNFFSQIGKVNNVIMIRDKHTGRHKGIGYVEMADLEDIPNCLLFNNVVPDFQKFAILVKPSEAEKNFVARKDPVVKDGKMDQDTRLYVGNIHISITEVALKSILEQFGQVDSVTLHRDEMGNSKGFAFARFSKPESAKLAMTNLGGLELAGEWHKSRTHHFTHFVYNRAIYLIKLYFFFHL